jgi:NDP-sugar pyrophosphorylase family protein
MFTVAVLAGGLATRLRPLTEKIPKSLLEVAGEPFIFHQLRLLRRQGIDNVVLCVGYLGEMIEERVGEGKSFGLQIRYAYDGSRPLGTAGALKQALPILGQAFFVLYGDSYLTCDYKAVQAAYERSGKPGLMTIYRNQGQYDASNVVFEQGRIIRYDKKNARPDMQYIDYGLGILHSRALDGLPAGEPADLADIYTQLALEGRLVGFESFERFYEIGSPAGFAELEAKFLNLHSLRGDI